MFRLPDRGELVRVMVPLGKWDSSGVRMGLRRTIALEPGCVWPWHEAKVFSFSLERYATEFKAEVCAIKTCTD
jgi:hypothetical protein